MKRRKTSFKHRDDEFLSAVIARIKLLRDKQGISQEIFYEKTHINIGRIERGASDFNMSTLKRICDFFGISPSEFLKNIK